jgi:hypothetical protein
MVAQNRLDCGGFLLNLARRSLQYRPKFLRGLKPTRRFCLVSGQSISMTVFTYPNGSTITVDLLTQSSTIVKIRSMTGKTEFPRYV